MIKLLLKVGLLLSLAFFFIAYHPVSAQNTAGCNFSTTLEVAGLYRVPFPDSFYLIGILTPNTPYKVLHYVDIFFQVETPTGQLAWVDARAGGTSGACESFSIWEEVPLTEFEGTCFVTITQETPAFSDAEMTRPSPAGETLFPEKYHVIRETEQAYLIALGHAMGVWIAKTSVTATTLGCNALPLLTGATLPQDTQAITLENARVWTRPDVKTGLVIMTLPLGTPVLVINGPVKGFIRFDTEETANFYRISAPAFSGWVWENRLDFEN